MKASGLLEKGGLAAAIFSMIVSLTAIVFFLLADAPFIIPAFFIGTMFYMFYHALLSSTRYSVDESGIRLHSKLPFCNKEISWNAIVLLEETVLHYTRHSITGYDRYYVIAATNDLVRDRGLPEMIRCKSVLCVPVTTETTACMTHFAEKYHLCIVPQKYD